MTAKITWQMALELESLVEELNRKNPDEKRVKALAQKLNIPFSTDPIEQMSTLLQELNERSIGCRERDVEA